MDVLQFCVVVIMIAVVIITIILIKGVSVIHSVFRFITNAISKGVTLIIRPKK